MWEVARRRAVLLVHLALGMVCILPLLLTAPGRLAADTRQAIYLDPGRFIVDALSMWDPSRDLGTVTHQNIVLVWPMGVWYWLADLAGVPLWVAQRAWTGSILFAAGAGVLYLARTMRWSGSAGRPGSGAVVAAFAYCLSPYVIQYGTRTSVLLLPWAALPWLIGLTMRALVTRGWRHPALFALVVMSIAVNATALVMALIGPALWIAWAVWGQRSVSWRTALGVVGRTAALGIPTSLWWLVALLIEGRYGLPLLEFTETIDQVASTSAATEVLRGLGYWVPYLQQYTYPEVTASAVYLQRAGVVALQLGLVAATVVGAALTRWGHRAFFGALVVVGVVVGVGAYPPSDASPVGSLFHDLARSGGVGLALRSTTRATPMALLGLACLLGAALDALAARTPRAGTVATAAALLVIVALAPTVATRDLVDPLYSRPEEVPRYWTDAIERADELAGDGRLLEVPGTRFAAYRWGNTYEPITAGLAETPTAWREQIPYGGAGSAELLVSLDNRLQEGRLDPAALAPVARLLGASVLVVRNDLAYERYDTVTPDRVWDVVTSGAEGLGAPIPFGPVGVNEPDPAHARDDWPEPAAPDRTYPAVALVPVTGSPALTGAAPLSSTVLLDGSGDGLIDAAGAGLLDGRAPVLYAGTTAHDDHLLERVLDAGAPIILTDTNRRRVERWRSVKNTRGITLPAGEDPGDEAGSFGGEATLDLLPSDPRWQTVAEPRQATVSATRYGNPLWFEAGVRPAAALDGDRSTAWSVGPTVGGIGDRLLVELDDPLTTDHLTIATTTHATVLTEVALRFDGGAAEPVTLEAAARGPEGQRVEFGRRTFERLEVELRASAPVTPGAPAEPIGIAELGLEGPGGQPLLVDEVVRLPTALTDRLGPSSIAQPMSVVLTRQRGDATGPPLFEEETQIRRELALPTDRRFALTGLARVVGSEPPAGCRSDLVEVDGGPVAVELRPALGGRPAGTYAVLGCEPIALDAGTHLVRTTGPGPQLRLDQLVLSSEAGGSASAVTADGGLEPLAASSLASETGPNGTTSASVEVAPTDGPAWVILRQSHNEGWSASTDAGTLEGPILLDGFANGFLVDRPLPEGATVSFRWTPQRTMWLSLALAALGILAAAVLALRGRRWAPPPQDPATVPTLDAPWTPRPALRWPRAGAAALGLGLAAAGLIAPLWAVPVGVLTLVGGRARRGRGALLGAATGALVGALGWVAVARLADRELDKYDFFSTIHDQHRLAMAGVLLLAADLALNRARPLVPVVDPLSSLRRAWSWALTALSVSAPTHGRSELGRDDRRRFAAGASIGALPGLVAFSWLVTGGTWSLLRWRPAADFYDAQAHALLDGRLDLPRTVLGIEAFESGGKAYMYQGPFPALLRLPVAAVTDAYDGRLAALSMLVALTVAAIGVGAIAWQVRQLTDPARPVTRGEAAGAGLLVLLVTSASVMLFLGSQVSVYHESALWGGALALAGFAALLRHLRAPGLGALALTTALTAAALWSRASTGLGLLAALGLIAAAQAVAWRRRRRRQPADGALVAALRGRAAVTTRGLATAVLACVLPLLLYTGVNVAKFGSVASVPWAQQEFSTVSSLRQEFLERNDGTFFGLQFLPGTLVSYLRPDAISVHDRYPWVGFADGSIGDRTGAGGALFDKVDATASLPVSHPVLLAFAVLGTVLLLVDVRRRAGHRLLVAPVVGAAAGAATIFVFGFVAQRYLVDVLPLLVLAAAVGLHRALTGGAPRAAARRARLVLLTTAALALLGAWTTLGLAQWYQAVYASPADEQAAARFFDRRQELPALPVGEAPRLHRGASLPRSGPAGDLFLIGECDGLYVSDGAPPDELSRTSWKPVARTPAVGAHDVEVVFAALPAGTEEPLLVAGTVDDPQVLSVQHLSGERVRIRQRGSAPATGRAVPVEAGRRRHLRVAADPGTELVEVVLDGRTVHTGFHLSGGVPVLGVNDLDASTLPRFAGTLTPRTDRAEACRQVRRSAGLGG